ncbi:metallophosphoesterase [Spirosoma fluviale]|uniref:Putative phosphoesterase n=1 Tax=Spirosoma fluviale TaxID=1597977 RepID=A0A286GTZ0_9BACT|nr:metallophosphoesterase [Spirosoma fluviale]SOD98559.1 putative phosphoesterase [Spirosoma fluviale]
MKKAPTGFPVGAFLYLINLNVIEMKLLTISDLHGRTVWKEANIDQYDRVIFLGDYTDSHIFDNETIFKNLLDIIWLKHQNPHKVVLLIGNHDAQYLHFPYYRCSGFREGAKAELSSLFGMNASLFQIAHQEGDYLFSHAGVTKKWLAHFLVKTGNELNECTFGYNLAGLLNEAHRQEERFRSLLFDVGPKRGGVNAFGGPIWADRSETSTDFLMGFQQVVGHTPVSDFSTIYGDSGSITYTDVLQTKTAFYEVIIPD